jgi:hypothetical protein
MCCWLSALVFLGTSDAAAQERFYGKPVYGAFGQRTLGQTLRPKTGQFPGTGIRQGDSGDFVGINPTYPGRMFTNGARYYGAVQYERQARESLQAQQAMQPQQQPIPEPMPLEQDRGAPAPSPTEPQSPDQWLRSPAGAEKTPASPSSRAPGAASEPASPSEPSTGVAAPVGVRRSLPFQATSLGGAASSKEVDARLLSLLANDRRINKRTTIRVTTQDGATILRGRVATANDRAVAEAVARMEPGVWEVRNELTVESLPPPVPPEPQP